MNQPTSSRTVVKVMLIATLLVGAALAAWVLAPLLFLVFGGVLLAVVLDRAARGLARHAFFGRRVAVGVILVLVVAVLVAFGWLFGHQIGNQMQGLREALAAGAEQVRGWVEAAGLTLPSFGDMSGGDVISRVFSAASSLLNIIAGLLIVLFIALYTAFSPGLYRRGVVLMLPERHRERAEEVLSAMNEALWRWMIGQFVSMATIFVLTTVALYALGVPMALVLGLIAGLAEFVPILGPFAAAVPAILVGLSVDVQTAVWVGVVYVAIQQVESYVIAPLAEKWAVALPPALTVVTTTAFGLLFGIVGVLFATPITVAAMVAVRMVYVRDALGTEVDTKKMPG